jgi:hypothetical protein
MSAVCALILTLPATLFAAAGPAVVTNPPASQVVLQDSAANFTVGADGTAPITYQWLRGGTPIASANSSSYTLASAQPADDFAQFSVIVSNSLGASTSAVAVLRVDPGVPGPAQTVSLIDMATQSWKYYALGDLGTLWSATNYNDTAWLSGTAMFGTDTPTQYPLPFLTPLAPPGSGGPITVYLRTHFTFNGDPAQATLTASNFLDDGAVFYLNGAYAGNVRVPIAPNQTYTTDADNQAAEGTVNGMTPPDVITLPTTNLVKGDNVLAVEWHDRASSSDKVFALGLSASIPTRILDTTPPLLERILPPDQCGCQRLVDQRPTGHQSPFGFRPPIRLPIQPAPDRRRSSHVGA